MLDPSSADRERLLPSCDWLVEDLRPKQPESLRVNAYWTIQRIGSIHRGPNRKSEFTQRKAHSVKLQILVEAGLFAHDSCFAQLVLLYEESYKHLAHAATSHTTGTKRVPFRSRDYRQSLLRRGERNQSSGSRSWFRVLVFSGVPRLPQQKEGSEINHNRMYDRIVMKRDLRPFLEVDRLLW